jgi:hypothetical protein
MILMLTTCDTVSSTGRIRYLIAASHPIGGAPSISGNSHAEPAPAFCAAIEVGPASDGIQNQPSDKRPSSAALDSAR